MKLEDIMNEWQIDSAINEADLSTEVLKIPALHHKYYSLYLHEKSVLHKYEAKHKILRLEKFEFYTQGPNEETPVEWKLPAAGRVLRADANTYVDADRDVINSNLLISLQRDKVEYLDSILKSFVNRGFNIKSAIDFQKFQAGL